MQNILILKLGALGDVVMATPLIEAITAHHSRDRCALLTSPAFSELFEAWPSLEVQGIPRRGVHAMWSMLKFMRAGRFDRVYDLQGNDRSGMLCALSGIAVRVGNHPRRPYTHHPAQAWDGQSHIFSRMVEVLASAGVEVREQLPVLPASARIVDDVQQWISAHHLNDRRFALLHAGASATRPEKRWPGFAELAAQLIGADIAVVWLGGSVERELNQQLASAGGIDATEAFSIAALAELDRHAAFAVTNDSGPMHVLAAARIPVFGLFGPSDWRRNHALGQADHVIACVDLDTAFHGQRSGDCLRSVTAAQVWSRLDAAGLVSPTA